MSLEVSSLRAMAHPVRLQMLSLLTGAPMSAAELARELDITQANASYHLRFLVKSGHVVEAGEQRIRGGVAKRYRYPVETKPVRESRSAAVDTSPRRRMSDVERRAFHQAVAGELVRRSALAEAAGPQHATDAELWVAPEVWLQVRDLVNDASNLLHASAQPPRSEGTIRVNMTAVLFEMQRGGHDGLDHREGQEDHA